MTKWNGINTRLSAVSDTPGVSDLQINTRMAVEGELQRRWGNSTTSLAKQSNPIIGIASAYPSGNPYVVFTPSGGTMEGLGSPHAGWDDPKLQPPIGFTQDPGCAAALRGTVGFDTPTESWRIFGTITGSCCYLVSVAVNGTLTFQSNGFSPAPTYFRLYPSTGGVPADLPLSPTCGGVRSLTSIRDLAFSGTYPTYNVTLSVNDIFGYTCGTDLNTFGTYWIIASDIGPVISVNGAANLVYSYVPKCNGCGC